MNSLPTLVSDLWRLAGGNPQDPSCNWNVAFDSIGLILFAPPRHGGYWCTPTNSVTFATTGGDGVHYSWLVDPEIGLDFAPIVMTVPMCDTPNLIVGANMREFLSLGCRYGYFALEQLIYHRQRTLDELASKSIPKDATTVERELLRKISDSFNLQPWEAPEERLATLQERFAPLIAVAPLDSIGEVAD